MTDDARHFDEAKRAQNQVVFREANEGIREVVEQFDGALPEPPFVCECSDPSCRLLVTVPLDVYAEVRRSPRRFIHAAGHESDGTAGTVVQSFDGFVVMEKSGVAAEVVENSD